MSRLSIGRYVRATTTLLCPLALFDACDPNPPRGDTISYDATINDVGSHDVWRRDEQMRDTNNVIDVPNFDVSTDVSGRRYPPDTTVIPPECPLGGTNGRITSITVGPDGCPSLVEIFGLPRRCECSPISPCCDIDSTCIFPVIYTYGSYATICRPGTPNNDPRPTVQENGYCVDGRIAQSPLGGGLTICIDCISCTPGREE